jgi:4-oxalocrotonate tautomerase
MPEVIIYAALGRTVDQKRSLVKNITQAFSDSWGTPSKNITIQIVECSEENKAKDGELFCDAERRAKHRKPAT